jgi:hypothetical protein
MEPINSLAERRKEELLNYIQNFYRSSWNWRSQRMHEKWDKFDRNYHSIYDPAALARKEEWQMKMFIGATVQNVEVITSQLFKTMMAPKPPIKTEAGPAGDALQAELIEEVLDYELRKGMFDVHFYDTLKEAVRYGSGFMKLFWERVEDTRLRRVAVEETPEEVLAGLPPEALMGDLPMRFPGIKGFEMQQQQVLLKNNLCPKFVHIRDIFPEPNTTTWNRLIHRDKVDYGTIVRHIARGEFFDVRDRLDDTIEGEKFEQDVRDIKQERGYFEQNREMAKFEKKHTVWEFWGEIPRKWIQFDLPDGDEAEELVPSKVMVASGIALLSSEFNDRFDGEPPFLKLDYIRTGESYGKGVPELILDDQDELNELRNARVDNVNLVMNKMIAVLEEAIYDPNDMQSKPGAILRLKGNAVGNDINKAFREMSFGDVPASSYRETLEIERGIQERTGANRVTLGSSSEVRDTNQTLGGMEMLRQMFNERVAAYGMVMESSFLLKAAEKIYSLIYQNLRDQRDLLPILGDDPVEIAPSPLPGLPGVMVPRFMAFAHVPPEEVGRSYFFKPMGIFSVENKVVKVAQFMDWAKVFGMVIDQAEAAKQAATLLGIEGAQKLVHPMPMLPPMPGDKETPGLKGGPNGNQPAFLPPNPVRRQPVVG